MIDDPFISVLLAPILISQGIYTRRSTLQLPEANGARTGFDGVGEPMSLLIIGDSAAAGVGVEHQNQALAGQLVSKLASDYSVSWRLEAQTGLKTSDVVQMLEETKPCKSDVVVVSLGVNDVTSIVRLNEWLLLQKKLCSLLVSKFEAKLVLLSSIPPMGRFPSLPQPLRWYLGRRSRFFNLALVKQVGGCSGLEYLDVNFPEEGDFIAEDGFHPSGLAYDLWSERIVKEIRLKL